MNSDAQIAAIVTGASHGIGAAIARKLAAQGARVIINFNSSHGDAQSVVAAIESAGGEAVAVRADLSDPAQIPALFDQSEAAFGPISWLVNNAAMRGGGESATQVDLAAYEKLFNTNLRGPVLCMAEFARRAEKSGIKNGRIVNISSGQARTPMPGSGLYAGAKGAIDSITRAFAADLGPQGITVNAVAPGATASDTFTDAVPQAAQDHAIQMTALGRLGTPKDIADVVAFLLSDQAHWITGQIIDANGGLRR